MGRTACTEPQCLYSRAIPLLPLWAVRPVQSLSACTVELYLYSRYGPYGLYRAPCLYKGALYLFYHYMGSVSKEPATSLFGLDVLAHRLSAVVKKIYVLTGIRTSYFQVQTKALQLHPTLSISNDDKFADIYILSKEY